MNIAQRLRTLIEERDVTVPDLALALAVSHRTIEGYLQGRPAIKTVVVLLELIEDNVIPLGTEGVDHA